VAVVSGEGARGEEGGHGDGRAAISAGGTRVEQVRFKRKLGRAGDKVSPNHFGPNVTSDLFVCFTLSTAFLPYSFVCKLEKAPLEENKLKEFQITK
jgi:hypothetical protein